jgi:nitrate/nitrite transporter NarK
VAQLSAAQALRSPSLWFYVISYAFLVTIANLFIVGNYVAFLQGFGMSAVAAGVIWGMMGICGIPARFIWGPLMDFFGRGSERWLFALAEIMLVVGVFGLFMVKGPDDFFWVWWWTVWWGLGWGACMTAQLQLISTYYGPGAYGSIFGIRGAVWALGGFIGPMLAGFTYDATGSYAFGLQILMVLIVIAVILMCFSAPPKVGADGKLMVKAKA